MTSKLFLEILNAHYEKEFPFVVYSKPNELKVKALLQDDKELHYTENFEEQGFVFAPFDIRKKAIIIPVKNDNLIEVESISHQDFNYGNIESDTNTVDFKQKKKAYLELAKKTISKIKEGTFKKVVISREERITLKEKNGIKLFLKLLETYKNALVYCFYHPKVGLWLGATPETFLGIEGTRFKTMSLAGTRKKTNSETWQKKELEEQQLVTSFITDAISPLMSNIKISEVETTQAGDLLHLRTTLSGVLNFEQSHLKILLSKLHPTPAVCGLPKEHSKAFILENEGYNREYYTGFLGELNFKESKSRNSNRRNVENNAYSSIKNTSNLYVNLRCMQIKDNEAIVYVGGGITKDSNAEKEWEETVNKSQTMKKVLY